MLKVRPSTVEDAPFLAETLLGAFESHMKEGLLSSQLPPGTSEETKLALVAEAMAVTDAGGKEGKTSAFTWQHFLVCEADGVVAGALVPFAHADHPESFELFGERFLAAVGRRLGKEACDRATELNEQLISGWKLVRSSKTCFHIEIVFIRQQFRGKGVLDVLMNEGFRIARGRGFEAANISVVTENIRARRAYERLGFETFFAFSYPQMARYYGATGFTLLNKKL